MVCSLENGKHVKLATAEQNALMFYVLLGQSLERERYELTEPS